MLAPEGITMLLTACGTGQRPEPVAVLVGSTVFQRTSPQRRPRLASTPMGRTVLGIIQRRTDARSSVAEHPIPGLTPRPQR